MSDKYTIEQMGLDAGTRTKDGEWPSNYDEIVGRFFIRGAMIRQLLDDHETMRRALEHVRDLSHCRPSHGAVHQIADIALGEVTK